MKEAVILFKFASRSRPEKFRKAMESITSNLAQPELARYLFTFDENDPTIEEYKKIVAEYTFKNITSIGHSDNKIHAINRNMSEANKNFRNWKIVCAWSDDMFAVKQGFDNDIREDFKTHFPDGDGVLHYSDNAQKSNCMTLSIMGKKYFNRRKYIYFPAYESICCDIEAQQEGILLNRYKYMGDEKVLFHHLHPSFGLAQSDSQYEKTEAYDVHQRDKQTLHERAITNYGLFQTPNGWDTKMPKEIKINYLKESVIEILERALNKIKAL